MDTFKGHDNNVLKKLCSKKRCVVVLIPNILTHKFQPLDLTVNKPAKRFLLNNFNMWYADQVKVQLQRGINQEDVKVSLKISHISRDFTLIGLWNVTSI